MLDILALIVAVWFGLSLMASMAIGKFISGARDLAMPHRPVAVHYTRPRVHRVNRWRR